MYQRERITTPAYPPLSPSRELPAGYVRAPRRQVEDFLSCDFVLPANISPALCAQWSVLADQAADPNCFAERWFLEPSLALLAEQDEVKLALVTSMDGLLVGLIPLAYDPTYGRLPVGNVMNWRHHHSFLGSPIVRRGMETDFWIALITALDMGPWSANLMHISDLPANSRSLYGLQNAAAKLGRPCDTVLRKQRAMLKSNANPSDYWEANVRKKKRKELNRLAKRLSEQGQLSFRTLEADESATPWIEAFLELERRGWKGRQGTALACNPNEAEFLMTVAQGAHAARKLDFHRMDLDGKPIAMLINFLTGKGGFSYKIAFDEDYARYSPGILIEQYNLRILDRSDIDWVDSCATENHAMIESIWAERREIVRVTVPIGSQRNRWVFRASRMAEDASSTLRSWVARFGGRAND
ncbi:GNAT family N-acetyltransferase [Parasphingopyxis sp. CP4]|uniref:GNAT family N-acetyltransferase n=1 Tax=Parasphingopyxis sp. CP4 TaxID=2724527 RepID=UPI0015A1B79E|nr:GNAT family N-acetyltransferase [Parasphingopyxis sp. CP4]QLC22397.1 GNAT family N-acetyltransferase [Parasphingopyxis sp. CP4]